MKEQAKIGERRRAIRRKLKIPLRLRSWDSSSQERAAESVNISASGALVETDFPLPLGFLIEIYLQLPEEMIGLPQTQWLCKARVVRIVAHKQADSLFRAGLFFELITAARG